MSVNASPSVSATTQVPVSLAPSCLKVIVAVGAVSALAAIGEKDRADDLMQRLLRIASPLGLYAEEFEVDRARHLGNFPQAFSHLALVSAAIKLERAAG